MIFDTTISLRSDDSEQNADAREVRNLSHLSDLKSHNLINRARLSNNFPARCFFSNFASAFLSTATCCAETEFEAQKIRILIVKN